MESTGLVERMKYLLGDAYVPSYTDFFVESAESDFKRLEEAMKLFKTLIYNIKNCSNNRFIGFANDVFIESIFAEPPLHLMLMNKITSTGNVVYNLKHDILTLSCLASVKDPPHKIKQQLIAWMNSNRSTIIHELIHYIDKRVGAIDINRTDGKMPVFGTPEYYNSEHEFNAYFNQFVYDIYNGLKKHSYVFDEFSELFSVNFNLAFDWLVDKVDDQYLNVMMHFNEKYRRAFISRLYKLIKYTLIDSRKK